MKKIYFIFFLAFYCINIKINAQSVNAADSLALVDLYNSTNGSQWLNHTNWLKGPVATWYGVQVNNARVTAIYLGGNLLTGPLPSSIGDLTALINLDVSFNGIMSSLPSSIGNLINLNNLYLNANQFSGSIPSSIGDLTKLGNLWLSLNNFSGAIPNEIGNCNMLTSLQLFSNNLIGEIPQSISNLTLLTQLQLFSNKLSGEIPSTIGNLINLTELQLADNKLSGSIPLSVGSLINLTKLDLHNNKLTGSIPSSITNLVNLTSLNFINNQLNGKIPADIGNMVAMQQLYLSNNHLSGSLPSSLQHLKTLYFLYADHNRLTGSIPIAFTKIDNLQVADLSNNQLSGTVPSTIQNFAQLQYLYLDSNNLSGQLPVNILKNTPELTVFTVNENQLTFLNNFKIPGTPVIRLFSFENNNFTFNGIENIAQKISLATYAPQALIKIHRNMNSFSVAAGGTISNNTYKWFRMNGTLVATIHGDSIFNPSETGNYYAEVTNSMATQLTLHTDTIHYNAPVSFTNSNTTAANGSLIKFKAYPNPVTNILYVEVNDDAIINIINENGETLFSKRINNKDLIDVSRFAPGVYYLQNETTGIKQKVVIAR